MDKETAWIEVITRLEELKVSHGVIDVFEGFKDLDSISDSAKPCIMVEPDGTEVIEENYDEKGGNYGLEQLNLIVWVLFVVWEKEYAVKGKVGIYGVFEWEKIIKDKLAKIPINLGNIVAKVRFGDGIYLRSVGETTKGIVKLLQLEVGLLGKYST